MSSSIEKYDGAIRMWRIWKYGSYRLMALVQYHVWEPGVNTAIDVSGAQGFYGFKDYHEINGQESGKLSAAMTRGPVSGGYVVGSILCYGRVVVGTKGARAQYAIPEYLVAPYDADHAVGMFELAEYYKCQLISEEQAQNLTTGLVPYRKPVSLEELLEEQ